MNFDVFSVCTVGIMKDKIILPERINDIAKRMA